MKTFINDIDFTTLRTQKTSLLATIEFMEKNKVPQILEDLTGILHLIDALQDYAVDKLGIDQMLVFDFEKEEERECTNDLKIPTGMLDGKNNQIFEGDKLPKPYFEIVHSGYQKELGREEIQIHGGENSNIFLIKTDEGFVVDVYGQNDLIDTMAIFEDTLNENDPLDGIEETGAPENFSEFEVNEFKKKWGT